jgi:predicted MFS family arabinose efflux permease
MHVVESGLQPLGALAGGLLAASIGVREAIWVAVFGGALGIVWLLASPLPGLRTLEAEPVKVE